MADIADTFDNVSGELKSLSKGRFFEEKIDRVLRELESDDAKKEIESFSDADKKAIEGVVSFLKDTKAAQEEFDAMARSMKAPEEVKRELQMLSSGRGDSESAQVVKDWLSGDGKDAAEEWFSDEEGKAAKPLVEKLLKGYKKASSRSALIHLASTLPKGSEERRTLLAGLRAADLG